MAATYIETREVPIGQLARFPGNAKRGDVDEIRSSIRRTGQYRSLVVRSHDGQMTILAGNHTHDAIKAEGHKTARCEIIECSDDDARRINLADNRLAELGEMDSDALADLLSYLDGDYEGTGYDDAFVDALLNEPEQALALTDTNEAPKPPEQPVTQYNDVWLLGPHRLFCGDCTDSKVSTVLGGDEIDLILTDPPYCSGGFQESGRSAGSVGTDAAHKQIANDRLSTRGYIALLKTALTRIPANYAYVFTDWRMWVYLFDVVESSGFGVRSMIVWDKGTPGMGRGWRAQHELVMWGAKKTPPFDKHMSGHGNVIQANRTGNDLHTTQKPVSLLADLLTVAEFARVVYDPFAGSGSTLIACEQTGRTARLVELDPAYCDVICRRYQEHTGTLPVLQSTGEEHDFTTQQPASAA